MGKRTFLLAAAGLVIALAVPAASLSAGTARAATVPTSAKAHPTAAAAQTRCRTTELTLHPGGHPTSKCLALEGSAIPNTFSRVCNGDTNDLELFWNGPINVSRGVIPPGPVLCIRGLGYLDLSAGLQPDGRNWNDQASAWWAGCSAGHFDQNAGAFPGIQQYFNGGQGTSAPSGNFDGSGLPFTNVLPNDSLTVVTLDSNC